MRSQHIAKAAPPPAAGPLNYSIISSRQHTDQVYQHKTLTAAMNGFLELTMVVITGPSSWFSL